MEARVVNELFIILEFFELFDLIQSNLIQMIQNFIELFELIF